MGCNVEKEFLLISKDVLDIVPLQRFLIKCGVNGTGQLHGL